MLLSTGTMLPCAGARMALISRAGALTVLPEWLGDRSALHTILEFGRNG
jgi:hypothetical protein